MTKVIGYLIPTIGLILTFTSVSGRPQEAPSHFVCMGNEPFWKLEIVSTKAKLTVLSDGRISREVDGTFRSRSDSSPSSFEWQANAADEDSLDFIAVIEEGECLDTMSDETPPYSYRAQVSIDGGRTLSGCCRTGDTPAPRPDREGISLADLPVADLAARPPEDWSRFLLDLLPSLEVCLLETPGSSPRVTKAWRVSSQVVGLRTRNAEGGWFECVTSGDGKTVTRFEILDPDTRPLHKEGRVVFSLAAQYPPSGACYQHERVLDENGKLVGWLSSDTC